MERTDHSREPGAYHRLLGEILRRVINVAEPGRVILFGSVARGEAGPDSDIDLLFVKSHVPHRRRLAQEIHRSFFGLAVPTDVVVVTPEDIGKSEDTVGTILGSALREGKEIYVA